MPVTTKQIAIFSKDCQAAELMTVQNYGVDPEVTGVCISVNEETIIASLGQAAEQLKEQLTDECTAVFKEASETGLGETFMTLLDALDDNLSAKIPSVFRGDLRKRIGGICMKMRVLMNHPAQALKGALTKTSEGYYLELWYLDECFTVYKDLVEAVLTDSPKEKVQVAPEPVVVQTPVPMRVESLAELAALMGIPSLIATQTVVTKVPTPIVHKSARVTTRQVTAALAQRGLRFF